MTAANFAKCLEEIFRQEGGYSDHPSDPGGATNMGITLKTLARWRGVRPWWKLPRAEMKALKRSEAEAIYKAQYWTPVAADLLPGGLDLALFDFAVNSGPARAVKSLQQELKVRRDGIAGPVTMRALKKKIVERGAAALIEGICSGRMSFLARLAAFAVFGRGWSRRVETIRKLALALAGADPDSQPSTRRTPMNILEGYKTYIVGVLMLLAGIAQTLGVDIPGFDGQSAGHLIMEGFAIVFLRKGLKSEIGNA